MIQILRFIGVTNAAIWLGAAIFFTFGVAPVFFSVELKGLLHGPFWPGVIAQMALERYFYLQYLCGAVAVAHLLAEWVVLGRALQKLTITVLLVLLTCGFLGGLWLQPKLKHLYLVKSGSNEQYQRVAIPPAEMRQAEKSFRTWHGISMSVNLLLMGGLVVYFWRVVRPNETTRFVSATKFRS